MSAQLKPSLDEPTQDHTLRFCPRCDGMLPISEFGINRARKDGRNRYCKQHVREQIYEFRRKHAGYKAAQYQRKQAHEKAHAQFVDTAAAAPAQPVIDRVFEYLQAHGHGTPKQINSATKISLGEIDIALTELLITRRSIGTRALTDHTRLYFCL